MLGDLTFGKVFVVMTVSTFLIGRKDLPKFAKYIGHGMGQSVGTLLRFKTEFWSSTKDTELRTLHREYTAGLNELQQIKSEMVSQSTSLTQGSSLSSGASSPYDATTMANGPLPALMPSHATTMNVSSFSSGLPPTPSSIATPFESTSTVSTPAV